MKKTCKIIVYGLVQGIGYRPFVAEQAEELNIAGTVKNAGGIVTIWASGDKEAVDELIHRLRCFAPKGAQVNHVVVEEEPQSNDFCGKMQSPVGFRIIESTKEEESFTEASDKIRFLPVDLPVCEDCMKELQDPSNRRFRYPFISCVSCGPRYSILKAIPYDRDSITMDRFDMCEACEKEYKEKGNRRRHAQTIACHQCGPVVSAVTPEGECFQKEFAIQKAVEALKAGQIVAIKDIGGFHFAFRPDLSEPSCRLRQWKHREKKPFAVMFANISQIREYCEVSQMEEELLESVSRPIALLRKKKDFCKEVCGESDRMGVMLPCNPLQILIIEETGPLVMTSGNRGGEPIIIEDEPMLAFMQSGCPDLVLTHDRPIQTPLDDSIFQVVPMPHSGEEKVQIIRRARGLVPEPIFMHRTLQKDAFAAGGDLKSVFALGKQQAVYLSQHFGDLEDWSAKKTRDKNIDHMKKLLHIFPTCEVADLHPGYISAKGIEKRYQHHHVHVASVMAEYGLDGPVLGVCFDGTGYGTDHSIWGGEFLLCEANTFQRVGSLAPVKLIGGDEGAKNANTILQCYQYAANGKELEKNEIAPLIQAALANGINTVTSSSMGRLFDAACALLEIKDRNTYEGECPIALEICANQSTNPYPFHMEIEKIDGRWQADGVKLLAEVQKAKKQNMEISDLAAGFHLAIVDMIVEICQNVRTEYGTSIPVALCGGTFFNRILLSETVKRFEQAGCSVYVNEKVPSGDGGLALGQMYLASWEEGEETCV